MAINTTEIQEFTDAEILKVLRMSLVNSAIASQYSISGRQLIRASPRVIQELIGIYEGRIAAADAAGTECGDGVALIEFNEPR